MNLTDILLLVQLLPLIGLSAFFSGAEVALFSIDKRQLDAELDTESSYYRYLMTLLESPRRLLVTILVGNLLVNTLAAIIAALFAISMAKRMQINTELTLVLQILILTVIIIVFGQIAPKVISAKSPMRYAKIASVPLYWISIFLYPVAESFNELLKIISSRVKIKSSHALTEDEIQHIASVGHEQGTLDEDEHELIKSVVESKTTMVREIMVHRTEIEAIPADLTFDELLESVRLAKHSRLPVYNDSIDDITGIIYTKDLLIYLADEVKQTKFSLKSVARKPLIVPETKLINDLMREFQLKKMHIAIVVDEYGGTAGIITLEDIIQEVIGELRDDFVSGEPVLKKIKENEYLVDGGFNIDEFAESLNIHLPEEREFDTVGGWVLNQVGQIPHDAETYDIDNLKITIIKTENNRILQLKIEVRT